MTTPRPCRAAANLLQQAAPSSRDASKPSPTTGLVFSGAFPPAVEQQMVRKDSRKQLSSTGFRGKLSRRQGWRGLGWVLLLEGGRDGRDNLARCHLAGRSLDGSCRR